MTSRSSPLTSEAVMSKTWRVGRKVGRTIYRQPGLEPSDDDPLIGVMDTVHDAALVVKALNTQRSAMSYKRIFRFSPAVGLGEGSELFVLTPSLKFRAEGDPESDFWLATKTWEQMGKPRRIEVEVRPLQVPPATEVVEGEGKRR